MISEKDFFLLLIVLLALTACSQGEAQSPKKEEPKTEATEKKEDNEEKELTEVGQVNKSELGTFELKILTYRCAIQLVYNKHEIIKNI